MYVLIILAIVQSGFNVSKQVYDGKGSCEDAAAVVNEMAQKLRNKGDMLIETRCVPQDRSRP